MAERIFIVEIAGEVESVLADLPIVEAAAFPFGQVLRTDGAGFEFLFKGGLDFGEGIEPMTDGFGPFVVLNAAVELLTDGMREASDFAGASFQMLFIFGRIVAGPIRHQNVGSNRLLRAQTLTVSFKNPWLFLAETNIALRSVSDAAERNSRW